MQKAVDNAYGNEILIVAAAGNDSGAVNYPAKYSSAIAVSAVDSTNTVEKLFKQSFMDFFQKLFCSTFLCLTPSTISFTSQHSNGK